MSSAEDAKSLPAESAEITTAMSTSSRSPYSLRRVQDSEERVRVKSVVVIAPLDPEPVPEGYAAAETEGR